MWSRVAHPQTSPQTRYLSRPYHFDYFPKNWLRKMIPGGPINFVRGIEITFCRLASRYPHLSQLLLLVVNGKRVSEFHHLEPMSGASSFHLEFGGAMEAPNETRNCGDLSIVVRTANPARNFSWQIHPPRNVRSANHQAASFKSVRVQSKRDKMVARRFCFAWDGALTMCHQFREQVNITFGDQRALPFVRLRNFAADCICVRGNDQ